MRFREFVGGVCILLLMAASIAAVFFWVDDRPIFAVILGRVVSVIGCLLAMAGLVWYFIPRDAIPDYLHQSTGKYFDRGGFCFNIVPSVLEGVCYLQAFFQNRHNQPFFGRIALRPKVPLIGRKNHALGMVVFDVRCPPVGFGVVAVPIALPMELQGQVVTFEVGAGVTFPRGRGRTLRFRNGIVIRNNSNFANAFGTALTVAGAMGGAVVLSSPASITMALPTNVAGNLSDEHQVESRILWREGDPPLELD